MSANLSSDQKNTLYCEHLKQALLDLVGKKRSKLHTLSKMEQPLCLHTVLCHSVEESPQKSSAVKTKFPGMGSASSDEFLQKSRKYLEKLVKIYLKVRLLVKKLPIYRERTGN